MNKDFKELEPGSPAPWLEAQWETAHVCGSELETLEQVSEVSKSAPGVRYTRNASPLIDLDLFPAGQIRDR